MDLYPGSWLMSGDYFFLKVFYAQIKPRMERTALIIVVTVLEEFKMNLRASSFVLSRHECIEKENLKKWFYTTANVSQFATHYLQIKTSGQKITLKV